MRPASLFSDKHEVDNALLVEKIQKKLLKIGNKEIAKVQQKYFKTGPGEYGEGDVFIGVRVPELRKLVKEYQGIPIKKVKRLLKSTIHEERLLALLMLVRKYSTGNETEKERIYELYLGNTRFVNNWDLVDGSAPYIVGPFLMNKSKEPLFRLAKSKNLWERRISIVSTFHFIKHNRFSETLKISEILLSAPEDLIHKAVGWMLREIGKRNLAVEQDFLNKHCKIMPRTMLRYAIERFPEDLRKMYLRGEIG